MKLKLKVVPGSSRDSVGPWMEDALKIKVKAPPENGKANDAVVALLAGRLGLPTSAIAITSGDTGPAKVVEIRGLDENALRRALSMP